VSKTAGYYVRSHDWPSGITGDAPDLDDVYEVLDQFKDYYDTAMEGLRDVAPEGPEPQRPTERSPASRD
jgi:hypothetical protein